MKSLKVLLPEAQRSSHQIYYLYCDIVSGSSDVAPPSSPQEAQVTRAGKILHTYCQDDSPCHTKTQNDGWNLSILIDLKDIYFYSKF